MTFEDAKKNLLLRYSKYGITEQLITDAMKDGIENYEMSVEAVYNGLRMSLSLTIAGEEQEYFTIEDVMSITGESRDEVVRRIEEMRNEVAEQGGNPDDYAMEVKQEKSIILSLPKKKKSKRKYFGE